MTDSYNIINQNIIDNDIMHDNESIESNYNTNSQNLSQKINNDDDNDDIKSNQSQITSFLYKNDV